MARFKDLTCEPYAPREGIVFSLQCSADLIEPAARLYFDVRFVDGRLVITSLTIDTSAKGNDWPRDAINATMLASLPVADLLLGVRDWIVGDGSPNSSTSDHRLFHDAWHAARQTYIGLLRDSADGPPSGRKVKRDDFYLEQLSSEYVRIATTNTKNPRAELADSFSMSEAGIATNLRLARNAGWLEPPSIRGARTEIAPGRLLMAKWEHEGYPSWHEKAKRTRNAKKGGKS